MADRVRLVCLDAMGLIYRTADDLRDLLIPFARERGSTLSDDDIGAAYRACSRGEFGSAELWRRLCITGDGSELDRTYLSRHELTPGIAGLVARWVTQGLAVACVSNDVSEWSEWLRARHALGSQISPWIVSGDVGVRKPDERIYREVLDRTHVSARECIFVDDRPANLDAASRLGFQTVLFGGRSADHRGVRDLADLEALIQEHLA